MSERRRERGKSEARKNVKASRENKRNETTLCEQNESLSRSMIEKDGKESSEQHNTKYNTSCNVRTKRECKSLSLGRHAMVQK